VVFCLILPSVFYAPQLLMRFLTLLTSILLLFTFPKVMAQPTKSLTNQDNYNMMFGLSWAMLDDDGDAFKPFNFGNYHYLVYPTRAFFDKYIYDGWSAEVVGTYHRYDPLKLVNDSLGITGSMFSLDAHMKYSLYKYVGKGFFEPYFGAGLGLTTRTSDPRNTAKSFSPTLNVALGMNLWVTNNVGLQFQTVGKIGVVDFLKTSDYIQHSAGLVVRIDKPDGSKSDFNKSKYKIKKSRTKIKIKKTKKSRDS